MVGVPAEMDIFARVVERGSFAGAAKDAGLSPSAVAKLVGRLELRLGVRLINRTTRRLALTPEGDVYLERAREILGAIEAAEAEIATGRTSPRGHLRVHAYPVIAGQYLAPALPDFLERYPEITFDFMVTNHIVDLVAENLDISLRLGPLPDSGLVARKIVDLARIVCASPGYIARHGEPKKPTDLLQHSCLTLSRIPGLARWSFRVNGKPITVDVKGPVVADSADMLLRLAIEGVGILRLTEHVVADSIRKGLLQPLLQDVQDPSVYPLYALTSSSRHQAPKVRAFVDFLIERLRNEPWLTFNRGRRGQ